MGFDRKGNRESVAKLVILGSASAVSDEHHENTHFAVQAGQRLVLIDAPSNPLARLKKAGLDPLGVSDLILTHFHPDHVSGVPLFIMVSWLSGRTKSLNIFGLDITLARMESLMDAYDWKTWPDVFPCLFHHLPDKPRALVLSSPELDVYASPVQHLIPNIGLRFEFHESQQVVAYSSDTQPTDAVIQLAAGADLLIHEASGDVLGHSSAAQAGRIAAQAGVRKLALIHYPVDQNLNLVDQARETFAGEVILTQDFMEFVI
jgi:ribonuclease Z